MFNAAVDNNSSNKDYVQTPRMHAYLAAGIACANCGDCSSDPLSSVPSERRSVLAMDSAGDGWDSQDVREPPRSKEHVSPPSNASWLPSPPLADSLAET